MTLALKIFPGSRSNPRSKVASETNSSGVIRRGSRTYGGISQSPTKTACKEKRIVDPGKMTSPGFKILLPIWEPLALRSTIQSLRAHRTILPSYFLILPRSWSLLTEYFNFHWPTRVDIVGKKGDEHGEKETPKRMMCVEGKGSPVIRGIAGKKS
jgi:hypothetical protein